MAIAWIGVDDVEDPDNPDAPYAIEYASWVLYKLTAEKYPGIQEAKEWYGTRNCLTLCDITENELQSFGIVPAVMPARFTQRKTLNLRRRPVIDILSVEDYETGQELDPDSYDLRNNAFLNSRSGTWDINCNGYVVNYLYGMEPPEAGKRAAMKLAQEIMKAITDPDHCELPDRVTSVNRQGVSYTILDPQDFITDGKTGIFEVDMFIRAANPSKALKRPRVLVPGAPQGESMR